MVSPPGNRHGNKTIIRLGAAAAQSLRFWLTCLSGFWRFLQWGICFAVAPDAIGACSIFTFIDTPDQWELGSKSSSWWSSQAEFAQITWIKNGTSVNHVAKLCHPVPGLKTIDKYSCHLPRKSPRSTHVTGP